MAGGPAEARKLFEAAYRAQMAGRLEEAITLYQHRLLAMLN